jgi:hypothetical protein
MFPGIQDMGTSGLEAAILDFGHKEWSAITAVMFAVENPYL